MFHHPMSLLRQRARIIIIVGFVFALVALIITFLFPLQYRADAQVLVISKSRYGVDPYTVVRSAERVGENVAQVMTTNDFFGKVMAQQKYALDQSYFQNVSELTKRKRWQKTLQPSMVYGTGVLNVRVYHKDKAQALALANASASVLASDGWEYVGGDVAFKIVNEAVATQWPVRPNVILNTLIGFVVGLFVMAFVAVRRG